MLRNNHIGFHKGLWLPGLLALAMLLVFACGAPAEDQAAPSDSGAAQATVASPNS